MIDIMDAGDQENFEISSFLGAPKLDKPIYGHKKNTTGEQVHGRYSWLSGAGLRDGSWVAGSIGTCGRFLL